MIIVNFKKLAKNSLREKALLIAEAGYEAIEIERTINKKIKLRGNKLEIADSQIDLNNFKRVFIIGIGKGSALASAALAKILGDRLTGGIALDVKKPKLKIKNWKLKIYQGTHPLPSKQNLKATLKIIKLAKGFKEDDLLITFICGGGSALLCGSEKELKYSQFVFKDLTMAGADIFELNVVRKHLSEIKGGGLAKLVYPANVVSLVVSDVLGNDLSTIASGPAVYDKTTKKDAEKIIKKYLRQSALRLALIHALVETPKQKKYFKKVKNILFLCNKDAVEAMAKKAEELGFRAKIHSFALRGEAKKVLWPMVKETKSGQAVLAAGETTVTMNNESKIKNYGKGGRNMESVLGVLNSIHIIRNSVILSFASDGYDNTEAAGAVGDYLTIKKAEKLKINPEKFLQQHKSFDFFKKTGDLIFVEQKCFNVADLMVVLKT